MDYFWKELVSYLVAGLVLLPFAVPVVRQFRALRRAVPASGALVLTIADSRTEFDGPLCLAGRPAFSTVHGGVVLEDYHDEGKQLITVRLPAGAILPTHGHDSSLEIFAAMAGVLTVALEGAEGDVWEERIVGGTDHAVAWAMPGRLHQVRAETDSEYAVLVIPPHRIEHVERLLRGQGGDA